MTKNKLLFQPEATIYRLGKDSKLIPYFEDGVCAGDPEEFTQVPPELVSLAEHYHADPERCRLVEVHGNSMIKADIMPGDCVVVDKELEPQDMDIVVGYLDGRVTLKYYHRDEDRGRIVLLPGNDRYKPVIVDDNVDFRIVGVATSIHRSIQHEATIRALIKKDYEKMMLLQESGEEEEEDFPFSDCILLREKAAQVNNVLHNLIDGRKGKAVALVIQCAIEKGIIQRPTYMQMKREFHDIGARSGFYNYINYEYFPEVDKIAVMNILETLK